MSRAFFINRTTETPASVTKTYISMDRRWTFRFAFAPQENEIAVYCLDHPPLDGRDPDPHKTHLFSSGKLCFVQGRGPTDQDRAEELAKQWAEYFLEYRRTGIVQS